LNINANHCLCRDANRHNSDNEMAVMLWMMMTMLQLMIAMLIVMRVMTMMIVMTVTAMSRDEHTYHNEQH